MGWWWSSTGKNYHGDGDKATNGVVQLKDGARWGRNRARVTMDATHRGSPGTYDSKALKGGGEAAGCYL